MGPITDKKIKVQNGKKEEEETFRLNTSNKSSSSLILILPFGLIYSQFNKKVISNLKLKDQSQKRL